MILLGTSIWIRRTSSRPGSLWRSTATLSGNWRRPNFIFPGDMLFKNFGVTCHGRVVFYDYDEIPLRMTECNFLPNPPPRYPEDEWSAEPWYSVAK